MVTWTGRVRLPDLSVADPIKFSSATLVKNYNQPHTLAVKGRLDNIRAAAIPRQGLVVYDDAGALQFSGILTSAQRVGDGTGTLMFTSDMVRLWWRICWPLPTAAWSAQTVAFDVQTAPVEDRIVGYINRNAGPGAYHSTASGTDPGTGGTFSSYLTITSSITNQRAQCVAPDAATANDLYMTQADGNETDGTPDNLTIHHFTGTTHKSSMTLPKGGHGDLFSIDRTGAKAYCTFRYRGLSMSHDSSGTWVRIPYTAGRSWTAAQALAYKIKTPPANIPPARRAWAQGETTYDGTTYRLYGTPYNNTGSTVTPAIPAFIEIIKAGVITGTIDCSMLGRIGMSGAANPIGNHMEPEGLAIIQVSGQPCLLVGFDTGTGSSHNQYLYTYPLKPTLVSPVDRRFPGLTLPTSAGRGVTGATSARFDILGQLVGTLAESADLSVDVVQSYTGSTPYLGVVVGDAPDMTDSIRVGTADQGGPIILGPDWSYTLGIPTVTTALSAAGGDLADRILNTQTAADLEALWGWRIEQLVDQSGSTDATDIANGLQQALDAGVGPTEISVPLGHSTLGFGTDIPLGAKISALLDGELVTERIRQITITYQRTQGQPTLSTTAVLGSPDAGLKTPTQKALAQMLRRIQNLERN